MKLADALGTADFVELDDTVFETAYLREPDEFMVADDVLIEIRHGETELEFTLGDLTDAVDVGDGAYRLKSGAILRVLTTATIH